MLYSAAKNVSTPSRGYVLLLKKSIDDVLLSKYSKLNDTVENYYELENFVVKLTSTLQSAEIIRVNKILKNSTVLNGNSYETGLLWKRDDIVMSGGYISSKCTV